MLSLMRPAADVAFIGAAYKILESLIFFPAVFVGLIMRFIKYARSTCLSLTGGTERPGDTLIFAVPLALGGIFYRADY